ncbi:hypothetical protein L596_025437 [Steinernema carpocapsae]|uniref:Uncharacterized protein n=1 Tax=Steinernema carpocapsae TaxID=34508 RepID=A0A4U5M7R7_STECR|nr:hypothetical protein L596_025437 [Steinernema carpocapsae]
MMAKMALRLIIQASLFCAIIALQVYKHPPERLSYYRSARLLFSCLRLATFFLRARKRTTKISTWPTPTTRVLPSSKSKELRLPR